MGSPRAKDLSDTKHLLSYMFLSVLLIPDALQIQLVSTGDIFGMGRYTSNLCTDKTRTHEL